MYRNKFSERTITDHDFPGAEKVYLTKKGSIGIKTRLAPGFDNS